MIRSYITIMNNKNIYLLISGSTKNDRIRTGTPYLRTDSTNALNNIVSNNKTCSNNYEANLITLR